MFTESAEFYDAIYSFKDYAAEAVQIADLVRSIHPQACTILDVACGTGEHARRLSRDHGFAVDGLDLDPALLAIARTKHPDGEFFQGSMTDFTLRKHYDVVMCLFSSIGYLVTLDRVRAALTCFRRHLRPAGVVIVEPWFGPGILDTTRVTRVEGTHDGRRVERINRNRVDGRMSWLHFEYRIEMPDGTTRTATEVHELGLFTVDEMRETFFAAGLDATHDPHGLTGRGLWTARASDREARGVRRGGSPDDRT